MRDGHGSVLKIHTPSPLSGSNRPLIVLVHGGGWISGSREQLTPLARCFVQLFGAVVVNVSYRLAPEFMFPTAQNDVWDSLCWLAANTSIIGADPRKGFVVGGPSAGGNISAACAVLSLQEEIAHPLTGQWLAVPLLMDEDTVPERYAEHYRSRPHNANAPILTAKALDELQKHTAWDAGSPLRHPVLAPQSTLAQLPKTYIQACGADPARDDALIYDEVLKELGVETKCDLYAGCPHAHWTFMPGLQATERAVKDILRGMAWVLGQKVEECHIEQAAAALLS